ncbi:MAG: hypothetical protein JWR17_4630 [Pseudomonas sp.]|jgi:hypothetical protein|nr:hypothetical protein [Pseudomonas sp.]
MSICPWIESTVILSIQDIRYGVEPDFRRFPYAGTSSFLRATANAQLKTHYETRFFASIHCAMYWVLLW